MPPNLQYPKSQKACMKLLNILGFQLKKRVGKGKHQYKYFHPNKRMECQNQQPFIIIPHNYFNVLGKKLCKKLICFGYSWDEIEKACKNL